MDYLKYRGRVEEKYLLLILNSILLFKQNYIASIHVDFKLKVFKFNNINTIIKLFVVNLEYFLFFLIHGIMIRHSFKRTKNANAKFSNS